MANTIRIKRRASGAAGAPASLANGEIAFNEVDDTLYYGKGTGGQNGTATTVETIGGKGAFVSLTGTQTITGNKEFSGTVTLPTLSSLSTSGNVTIGGDLVVNGTTTTINSTTVSTDDKNIELASTVSPSDNTADGAGLTIKGTSDKTFNWVNATGAFTSSEHINLASTKAYYINGTSVLSATALGSSIVSSSLTSLGTVASGTWQGSAIAIAYGGTGATTASGVRANLGLGTMAVQNANNVNITGGSISNITMSGVTMENFEMDAGTY